MAYRRSRTYPGRQRLVCRLGAVILLGTTLLARHARAADIAWSAPPACGYGSAIQDEVEQLIQRPLAAVQDLDFDVRVETDARNRWRLSLRTRPRSTGAERLRELSGASCQEVKDAAALSIAMTINASEQLVDPAALRAAPVAATPPLQTPVTPQPTAAPGTATDKPRLGIAVAAGLALDLGVLPALAPGPELELLLRFSGLRLIALGTLFPPQRKSVPETTQAGDFGLALGAVLGCAELGFRRVEVLGCAGFEVGRLSIEPVGLAPLDTRSRLAYGPRAELGVGWKGLGNLGLFVRVGGTAPAQRYEFQVADRPLYQPSAVSLRATLGVDYAL